MEITLSRRDCRAGLGEACGNDVDSRLERMLLESEQGISIIKTVVRVDLESIRSNYVVIQKER